MPPEPTERPDWPEFSDGRSRQVIIAGAGIAGLTAALAFAGQGFSVQVFERLDRFGEIGAGLQLSPNATRLLDRLGVLDAILPVAVIPQAVSMRSAYTMKMLGRFPLGENAQSRWHAPYIVVHRADLQSALVAAARQSVDIRLNLDVAVRDVAFHASGVTVSVDMRDGIEEFNGLMAVAADGVWSNLRKTLSGARNDRFSGSIAWRTAVRAETLASGPLAGVFDPRAVTTFLGRKAHLVSYPIRSGTMLNLVAVTRGPESREDWAVENDIELLERAFSSWAAPLAALPREVGKWTTWPLHTVDVKGSWVDERGLALIGDAAHAMTPFAAQGAAMAIEDAVLLARLCGEARDEIGKAIRRWEILRRPRVEDVVTRGAFNKFVWHAAGAVAWGRDLVLRTRSPESLVADLDWLYGYDADADE